jgi:hypothetical protein
VCIFCARGIQHSFYFGGKMFSQREMVKTFGVVMGVCTLSWMLMSCNSTGGDTGDADATLGEGNGIALSLGGHVYKLGNASTPPAYGTTGKRLLTVSNQGGYGSRGSDAV